jgi:hypothetical protein
MTISNKELTEYGVAAKGRQANPPGQTVHSASMAFW